VAVMLRVPYYSDDLVTIYYGDCLDVLRTMDDAECDGAVIDPPFTEWGGMGPVLREMSRVAQYGYWIAFSRMPATLDMWDDIRDANASGSTIAYHEHFSWTDTQPRFVSKYKPLRTHEDVTVLQSQCAGRPHMKVGAEIADRRARSKGKSSLGKWTKEGRVYEPGERKHMTTHLAFPRNLRAPLGVWQKPDKLMQTLAAAYFHEATCVIDPFCGSGTTLACASAMGIRSIGIETDERHCEIAAQRCIAAKDTDVQSTLWEETNTPIAAPRRTETR
jgi:site-specific DNA-methyltransferase (adenine-specific)